MLFFKGGEPEDVRLEDLTPMLNALFDKKLGRFRSRAEALNLELREALREFDEACMELASLNAEPEMEDLYMSNYSSIKLGKSYYAKALKNAINSVPLEAKGDNEYESYSSLLRSLNDAIESVQKVNASFKTVVYSYSNYLRKFKKSFSSMERIARQLGVELESKRRDYEAYSYIATSIKELGLEVDKLKEVKVELEALNASLSENDASKLESEEAKISKEITVKRLEMTKSEKEMAELSAKIQSLVAPLNRISKKFDHLTARKQQLHKFIEDPIKSIANDAEYAEFVQLLKELKDYLQKNKLEVEDRDIFDVLNSLLSHNIYDEIKLFAQIDASRKRLLEEIATMTKVMEEVTKNRMNRQHSLTEIEILKKEIEETEHSINSSKAKIEKLFFEQYHKKIRIIHL